MKRKLMKSMIAAGAVAMICACGDDSASSNPATPIADNACAKAVVTADAWLLNNWVIYADGNVTDLAGTAVGYYADGIVMDLAGAPLAQNVNLADLTACAANATINPDTGLPVMLSSSSVASNPGDPTNPTSSAGANPGDPTNPTSSAGTNPGDPTNPTSSAEGTNPGDPTSSAGTEPTVSSSSVNTNPDLDENGFPTLESYGAPPEAYTKDILINGKTGWSSRYWDACKPHCSWLSSVDTTSEEAYKAGRTVARNCNIHDVEVPAFTLGHAVQQYWMGYEGTNSACVNENAGGTYTCTDMAPIQVTENLSYGYVAAPGDKFGGGCGKCFHLQFNGGNHANDVKATHKALKGKHMIVMASNIGYDVEEGQYDMLVPGGGVGAFNALSMQIGVPASGLGANGGGFLTECQQSLGWDNTVESYQECVIKKCDEVFKDWPNLLRGCKWYAEWYMAADNPTYNWEEVECPQYLIDHYMTTINTTIENRFRWRDDWSDYKKGDALETQDCLTDEYPQGCAP